MKANRNRILLIVLGVVLLAAAVGAFIISNQLSTTPPGPGDDPDNVFTGGGFTNFQCPAEANSTITFDTLPGVTGRPAERTTVTNQFESQYGFKFSGYSVSGSRSCVPRICHQGDPYCGFEYQAGGRKADQAPSDGGKPVNGGNGRSWVPNFMAMDEKCALQIDFTSPTRKFTFDILDIDIDNDDNEGWTVVSYNKDGQEITNGKVVLNKAYLQAAHPACTLTGDHNCGDGRTTPVNIDVAADVYQIKIIPTTNDNSFGLGFDNFTSHCTPVASKPLTIEKLASATPVVSDDKSSVTFDYTLEINNPNSFAIDKGIVEDILPAGATAVNNYRPATSAPFSNPAYDAGTRKVTLNNVKVPANDSITVNYSVTYAVTAFSGNALRNVAAIFVDDNNNGKADSEEKDDEDDAEVNYTVNEDIAVSIVKGHTITKSTPPIEALYTITVTNSGDDLNGYSLVDTYDTKIQPGWIGSLTPSGILDGGKITWENISLGRGQSASFTYTVTFPTGTAGTFNNIVILQNENDEEVGRDDDTLRIDRDVVVDLPKTGIESDLLILTAAVVLMASAVVVYRRRYGADEIESGLLTMVTGVRSSWSNIMSRPETTKVLGKSHFEKQVGERINKVREQ